MELIKISKDKCSQCKYHGYLGNGRLQGYESNLCCNYSAITGELRAFKDGKQIVPHGMCDKFEKGKRKREVCRVEICRVKKSEYEKYRTEAVTKWQI